LFVATILHLYQPDYFIVLERKNGNCVKFFSFLSHLHLLQRVCGGFESDNKRWEFSGKCFIKRPKQQQTPEKYTTNVPKNHQNSNKRRRKISGKCSCSFALLLLLTVITCCLVNFNINALQTLSIIA